MKRRGCLATLAVLVLIGVAAFFLFHGASEDSAVAQQTAKSYYEAIQKKDFEGALASISPRFFQNTPRSEVLQMLHTINSKLGSLDSFELVNWRTTSMAGVGQATGTTYVLSYRVNYSRYEAQETITLFKAAGEDAPQIIGYNVNSKAFIIE